jgi:hypothetical protein
MHTAVAILEINIKRDWPTVEVAQERLKDEIARARRNNVKVLKIIHGYGSTGKGGILREELRDQLTAMKKSGSVRQVVYGENFSMFDQDTAGLTGQYPELLKDRDYNRSNKGVTLIAL